MVSSRQLMALRSLLVVVIACYLGSECRVQARSSSCLAAEVKSWWCCQDVDNTVHSAVVLRLRVLRPCLRGSSTVVKLLGGRGAIVVVSSRC